MNLFIDDKRNLIDKECIQSGIDLSKEWFVARTSQEAKDLVLKHGMPSSIAFDYDLEGKPNYGDNSIIFLRWLIDFWKHDVTMEIPSYTIHSANEVGVQRIYNLMNEWKKLKEQEDL